MQISPMQSKRVEGVVKYVRFFMDKRSEHACRINPAIGPVYTDLSWQQLEVLRHILCEQKGFGPDRIVVADILASEDESKKRALFSPVDQNSILKEVVASADDARAQSTKRTAGIININDIQTLYQAINPNAKPMVDLIQTWIWWDLQDAADLFCLDQQIHRINVLATHEIDPKVTEHYRAVFNRPKGDISRSEILQHELQVLTGILGRLHHRVEHEQPYQVIMGRRDKSDTSTEAVMQTCLQHIERLRQLESVEEFPPKMREHYAELLSAPSESITLDMARQAERAAIGELKNQIQHLLEAGVNLGEAYNFKLEYIHEVDKRCKAVLMKMKKMLTEGQGAVPASAEVPL